MSVLERKIIIKIRRDTQHNIFLQKEFLISHNLFNIRLKEKGIAVSGNIR